MRHCCVVAALALWCWSPAAAASSPVLLVPGFAGWTEMETFGHYFGNLRDALDAAGADAFEMAPPPVASSRARAAALIRKIDEIRALTGAEKVAIIAHSQGGLDVREAIARGAGDKIAVVVTLSSPHHGTDLADAAREWLPSVLVNATLAEMQAVWEDEQHLPHVPADPEGALWSLSRAGAAEFNATHKGSGGVPFFSLAAVSGDDVDGSCKSGGRWGPPRKVDLLHPLFTPTHALIRAKGGNESDDGVVPTNSMRWGHYLGCIPGDHVDWMGWRLNRDSGAYAETDARAFLVELWRGMRDVEERHDEAAMDAHVPALAHLAHAEPLTGAAAR